MNIVYTCMLLIVPD